MKLLNKLEKKYKLGIIVLALLIIVSISVGISYALWQITAHQNGANEIASGCFKIDFEETGNDINLTNTYPISDAEGFALTPYKFKITNSCSIDAEFYVTLNSFGSTLNLMNENAIAFAIDESANSVFTKQLLKNTTENVNTSNIDLDDLIKSYIIKKGFLRNGESKEYSVLLWMDESATNSEMSKEFHSKIYITSVAVVAPAYANLIKVSYSSEGAPYLGGPITNDSIESLEFVDTNIIPNNAIGSWDVSEQKNGGIIAWYYDSDSNGKYELYIGQQESVIANIDSSYLFYNLRNLNSINLNYLNTSKTENMTSMFHYTGFNSTSFKLDLGNNFDTSNVTSMSSTFAYTGSSSPVFTLNLGTKFNTSKVRSMSNMFSSAGQNSPLMTLNLGEHFDTSNVEGMSQMFSRVGYSNLNFTLDLGSKFDTSKVRYMDRMFESAGHLSNSFTLNLGNHFNTSSVERMNNMFESTGYTDQNFNLDLGPNFDTIKVSNMSSMFNKMGYSSKVINLELGSKFNTSNVTDMSSMFASVGYSNPNFVLNLGSQFQTYNVMDMAFMFASTAYNNPNMIYDLRTFDISSEADVGLMFGYDTKNSNIIYVKDSNNKYKIRDSGNMRATIIDCSSTACP